MTKMTKEMPEDKRVVRLLILIMLERCSIFLAADTNGKLKEKIKAEAPISFEEFYDSGVADSISKLISAMGKDPLIINAIAGYLVDD